MLKPDAVMARVEMLREDEKRPFIDVSLWLNQEPDIIAHVTTRMWFSGGNVDLPTMRKAAIQQALWVCEQISKLSNKKEMAGIPEDYWRTGGPSRPDLERV
jgi:hypothetical protein